MEIQNLNDALETFLGRPLVFRPLYGRVWFCGVEGGKSQETFFEQFPSFAKSRGFLWTAKVHHHQTPRLRVGGLILEHSSCSNIDIIYAPSTSLDVLFESPEVMRSLVEYRAILGCENYLDINFGKQAVLEWREVSDWLLTRWVPHRGLDFIEGVVIAVIAAVSEVDRRRNGQNVVDLYRSICHFFKFMAAWRFPESSVAAQIGDCFKGQGIINGAKLAQEKIPSDKIPLHKKPRFAIAQIQDMQMSHEIGPVGKPVALPVAQFQDEGKFPGWSYEKSLDNTDPMAVISPGFPGVNLAIGVLETHKKIFIQELYRGRLLLEETQGISDAWAAELLTDARNGAVNSVYPCDKQFPVPPAVICFQVEAADEEAAATVASAVQQYEFFCVQELQGYVGVFPRPWAPTRGIPALRKCRTGWMKPEMSAAIDKKFLVHSVTTFVCEIWISKVQPFGAQDGVCLDLNEPVVKTLLRVRKLLEESPRLIGRFSLSGGVLKNEGD